MVGGVATSTAQTEKQQCNPLKERVVHYRNLTWKWQEQRDKKATHSRFHERHTKSCLYLRWLVKLWQQRAHQAAVDFWVWYKRTYAKWECIHQHEGSWQDKGAPYYGGLQMDYGFQSAYGAEFMRRWGDASNWPVWAQLIAAERAYATRGFGPWPNTRRYCGI